MYDSGELGLQLAPLQDNDQLNMVSLKISSLNISCSLQDSQSLK